MSLHSSQIIIIGEIFLFLQRSNSFLSCLHTSCKVHRHLETWKPYQSIFRQINKWHHIPQICNPRCNYQMCPCHKKLNLKSVRNISRAVSPFPQNRGIWVNALSRESFFCELVGCFSDYPTAPYSIFASIHALISMCVCGFVFFIFCFWGHEQFTI